MTKTITVRLDGELEARLLDYADATGVLMAQAVRAALNAYLPPLKKMSSRA